MQRPPAARRLRWQPLTPGKVLPVDLKAAGGRILAQKDAFLCAASGTRLDIAFNKKFGTGLFGGEGFILQDVSGDGLAFLHAGGTIVRKRLQGETLRVDTGCLVAFQPQIQYSIERAGNLKSMVFGGEGLFLATLSGTGDVWLQSLPFNRLADRVLANLQPRSFRRRGLVDRRPVQHLRTQMTAESPSAHRGTTTRMARSRCGTNSTTAGVCRRPTIWPAAADGSTGFN